jgi:hypothetical protein
MIDEARKYDGKNGFLVNRLLLLNGSFVEGVVRRFHGFSEMGTVWLKAGVNTDEMRKAAFFHNGLKVWDIYVKCEVGEQYEGLSLISKI